MKMPLITDETRLFTGTAPKRAKNLLNWVEALESEKFKQGVGQLRDDDKYCCLGVACNVLKIKAVEPDDGYNEYTYDGEEDSLPEKAVSRMGLLTVNGDIEVDELHDGHNLANLNDGGATFKQIAKFIRDVFKHQFGKTLEKAGK